MKGAILVLAAIVVAGSAYAGVTINYEGLAPSEGAVDEIAEEALAFAKARGWRTEAVSKKNVNVVRMIDEAERPYTGPLRGVVLFPSEACEPVHLEFGSDLFMQDFVKTQSAGPDIHIAIIELFKRLKPKFKSLTIDDEGEYWETQDRKHLADLMGMNDSVMDVLRSQEKPPSNPPRTEDGRILDVVQ